MLLPCINTSMLNNCPDEQSDRTTSIHRYFRYKRCSSGKDETYPLHGARFDVTTGKKIGEPMALDPSKFPEPIPESLQKMFAHSAEITSKVKTYDQPTYEIKVEGNRVKVRMGFHASRN